MFSKIGKSKPYFIKLIIIIIFSKEQIWYADIDHVIWWYENFDIDFFNVNT